MKKYLKRYIPIKIVDEKIIKLINIFCLDKGNLKISVIEIIKHEISLISSFKALSISADLKVFIIWRKIKKRKSNINISDKGLSLIIWALSDTKSSIIYRKKIINKITKKIGVSKKVEEILNISILKRGKVKKADSHKRFSSLTNIYLQ